MADSDPPPSFGGRLPNVGGVDNNEDAAAGYDGQAGRFEFTFERARVQIWDKPTRGTVAFRIIGELAGSGTTASAQVTTEDLDEAESFAKALLNKISEARGRP
jgi:hypothetical protein